jgi:hypothetical protein
MGKFRGPIAHSIFPIAGNFPINWPGASTTRRSRTTACTTSRDGPGRPADIAAVFNPRGAFRPQRMVGRAWANVQRLPSRSSAT